MVSEADEESTDAKKRSSTRPKKSKRQKPPIPQTEPEIDSPDRLTMVVLGFMGVVTLVLWGFARGACNYHPPRETRVPRAVKLEDLAREPKDAALEMQQRFLMANYAGAAELSTGEALVAVQKVKSECEQKPQDCAMKRKNLEKHVLSTPALLERTPSSAVVRVTSEVNGKKEVSLLTVERAGAIWKVASRVPDDGSYRPQARPEEPPVLGLSPPVMGSAVPVGSAVTIPLPSGTATSRTFVVRPPPPGAAPSPVPPPPPPAAPPPAPPHP